MADDPLTPASGTPDAPGSLPALRPSTIAVTAGRPGHTPDAPLNVSITMASTFVAGGDLEYGRYANPTWSHVKSWLSWLWSNGNDYFDKTETKPLFGCVEQCPQQLPPVFSP